MQKNYLGNEPVDSIYFGGGTPSMLNERELAHIFETLFREYHVRDNAEITLEANPDDMDEEFMERLKSTPVNRLSIGIQSFRDEDLSYLNRVHTARQAEKAIQLAQDSGYSNLSIDLIFGIPTLSDDDLNANLAVFFSLQIPHLSAYALTVEPKTALDVLIRKGIMQDVDEAKMERQFYIMMKALEKQGYVHYEVSNYSKPDRHALHNTNYWLDGKYLGLGPSAHSYNGHSRRWNGANLARYVDGIESGNPVFEQEELSTAQKYNEYVMVSLRTYWGADQQLISKRFGESAAAYFLEGIQKFIDRGMAEKSGSSIVLTEKGKIHADGIASSLFWTENDS